MFEGSFLQAAAGVQLSGKTMVALRTYIFDSGTLMWCLLGHQDKTRKGIVSVIVQKSAGSG